MLGSTLRSFVVKLSLLLVTASVLASRGAPLLLSVAQSLVIEGLALYQQGVLNVLSAAGSQGWQVRRKTSG